MSNEDIAKELLSVLMEKMRYREGLPSEGWAVEKICNALVAAQKNVQSDLANESADEVDPVTQALRNLGSAIAPPNH